MFSSRGVCESDLMTLLDKFLHGVNHTALPNLSSTTIRQNSLLTLATNEDNVIRKPEGA